MNKRIIGLITDFGARGQHYVATMKAVILKINPNVEIIDINHSVSPFNIYEASFLIKTTHKYFPKGSIFIIVVDPGVGTLREILAIKLMSNHFFIGPNNGIFTNTFNLNDIVECVKIQNDEYFLKPISNTFHGRDVMAPVGAYISKSVDLKNFGPPFDPKNFVEYPYVYQVFQSDKIIKGTILYIDQFGNGITNIPLKENKIGKSLLTLKEGGIISLIFKNKKYAGNFTSHYDKVPKNSILFLEGSYGLLEISLNQGNAAEEIGFNIGDSITIKF
ncbi:MAG: S-adenosyl-l-methionine hydroxide adenosyltransferase family protein [Candidatus Hodarchaeota archaeon]